MRKQARELRDRQQQRNQEAAAGPSVTAVRAATSRPRRGPLMIGTSSSSSSSAVIAAANKWYRKSVYYIDNVSSSVTENHMKDFIRSLSVRLVSCHAVQPRRRRRPVNDDHSDDHGDGDGESDQQKTTAFRVYINSDDKTLLLDEQKWPVYVRRHL